MNDRRDDYLWDPAAAPDAEVQALERALRPLAWTPQPAPGVAPRRRRWPWLLAAALLAVAVGVAFAWANGGDALRPAAASRTFVARKEPLRIPLGDLAEVTLRPDSELEFVHWTPAQALFALRRGSVEARVAPPPRVAPGFFAMDTPLGRVVDQGCHYEVVLHDDGRAFASVTEGAVTFAAGDRTVYVPAGASVWVAAGGASTPLFTDAGAALRAATQEFDALRGAAAGGAVRGKALKQLLAAAREPRDSLVLWHLLRDPDPTVREVAEDHLLWLLGPPHGAAADQRRFDPEDWLAFLRLQAWQGGR